MPLSGDLRGRTLRRALVVSDLLGLVLAFVALSALGAGAEGTSDALVLLACLPLWALLASPVGLYDLPERGLDYSIADEIGRTLLVAMAWSWLMLVGQAATGEGGLSAGALLVPWLAAAGGVLACRATARRVATRRDWYRQRVLVLGAHADAQRVVRRLRRHPEYGLDVAAVAGLDPLPRGAKPRFDPELAAARAVTEEAENPAESPAAGLLGRIERLVQRTGAQRVILATAPTDLEERSVLVRGLIGHRIAVDLVSAQPDGFPPTSVLHYIEGLPMLTVSPVRPSRVAHVAKRATDLALSGAALVVMSPLLAFCAARIKLDSPGPVLFRQRRIGRDGHTFQMLKFRTMVADAEERKDAVGGLNMHGEGELGQMFKIPSDPRVTASGRWLRRWSLDELPQLFNVLRGDMSLVGPRPLIPIEAELVSDHYAERERMRPGITGPWQVHGRSDIGFDDMVRLDYSYSMHWSLAEDMRILIRTASAVVAGRGAY